MPTKDEWQELIDKCTWTYTWTWYGSVYEVESKTTGNVLYLPAAGEYSGPSLYFAGQYGNYWGAAPDSGSRWAWGLYFDSDDVFVIDDSRNYGRPVRPVLE